MIKYASFLILILLQGVVGFADVPIRNIENMSQEQKIVLARVIFRNETDCNAKDLMQWNKYENFLSLGIMHSVSTHRFYSSNAESFTSLWKYLMTQHSKDPSAADVPVPAWMRSAQVKPGWLPDDWVTIRQEPSTPAPVEMKGCFPVSDSGNALNYAKRFDDLAGKLKDSPQVKDARIEELREFLNHPKVVAWQSQYVLDRTQKGLTNILRSLSLRPGDLAVVQRNMSALLTSERGIMAMVDYTNWKGEGLAEGVNTFGLRQVLLNMRLPTRLEFMSEPQRSNALGEAFGAAASQTLSRWIEQKDKEPTDISECGLQRAREQYNRWRGWLAKDGDTYSCYPKLESHQKGSCTKKNDGGFYARIKDTYIQPNLAEIQKSCGHLGVTRSSDPSAGEESASIR